MVLYKEVQNVEMRNVEKFSKKFVDALNTKNPALMEKVNNLFTEDVSIGNNGDDITTTVLAKTLYYAAYDKSKELFELTNMINDVAGAGAGAYKFPVAEPTFAVQVAEGAVVSYGNDQTRNLLLEPYKIAIGTKITWEMQKRGMSGFVEILMRNASDSIMRKVGGDIVNGLAAGAALSRSLAADSGSWWDSLENGKALVTDAVSDITSQPLGFTPTALVLNGTNYAAMVTSTDMKNAINPFNFGTPGIVHSKVAETNELTVYKTPLLTHSGTKGLIVDQAQASIFVMENDMETVEGRLPGTVDKEIIQVMSYAFGVLHGKAICRIIA